MKGESSGKGVQRRDRPILPVINYRRHISFLEAIPHSGLSRHEKFRRHVRVRSAVHVYQCTHIYPTGAWACKAQTCRAGGTSSSGILKRINRGVKVFRYFTYREVRTLV